MPASTYSKEKASDYALYKISSYGNPWDRRAFSIVGAFNGSPYMFVGGCYTKSGINEQVIEIKYTYSNPQFIKFYKKDGEVYVFFNAVSSNSNRAWFTSETGLALISSGNPDVIDESYTPIDVKSSVFGYDTIEELSTGVAEKIKPVRKRTVLLNNTYEISVSLNGIASDDGAPQKWTLYAGQWGKKDIYYAEGIFRVYGSGSEYNNAAVTGKPNEFTSLKVEIDSNNNLKVHTGLQLSYLELEVYY